MQLTQLIANVSVWADEKGILRGAHPLDQMGKMVEEVSELDEEVGKAHLHDHPNTDAIRSELGDVLVTCIIQANMQGLTLSECLDTAYAKISKRTGKLENGVFKKDE